MLYFPHLAGIFQAAMEENCTSDSRLPREACFNYVTDDLMPDNTSVYFLADGTAHSSGAPTQHEVTQGRVAPSSLLLFHLWFVGVHGYLSVVLCTLGLLLNAATIVALQGPDMRSPTNFLLKAIATFNITLLVFNFTFSLYFYCIAVPHRSPIHSYGWIVFLLIYGNVALTTHTAATWLTVALVVFRFLFIRFPMKAQTVCTMYRSRLATAIVVFCSFLLCVPNYLSQNIKAIRHMVKNDTQTEVITGPEEIITYWTTWNELSMKHNRFLMNMSFWLHGVILKNGCCWALVVVCLLIIVSVQRLRIARVRLLRMHPGSIKFVEETRNSNRMSIILVAVAIIFVMTEAPNGLLLLLSAIIGKRFYVSVYLPLGDSLDVLSLIQTCSTFCCLCFMSKQFRASFRRKLIPKCRPAIEQEGSLTSDGARLSVRRSHSLEGLALIHLHQSAYRLDQGLEPLPLPAACGGGGSMGIPLIMMTSCGTSHTSNGYRSPNVGRGSSPLLDRRCTVAEHASRANLERQNTL